MAEYIERSKAKEELLSWARCIKHPEHLLTEDAMCVLDGIPAADVVEVVPELRKTVELLHNEYERAKRLEFVYDPLAYAVYQVWKAVDGRRKNGR